MAESFEQAGRYKIIRVLGKGAMGVVYLAHDPQIGRKIALKTIRPKEGAREEEVAESRTRFLREAQAAGRLLHPSIVTIFDVFEDQETMFIAMEFVEGVLLDHFCVKGRLLPLERAISLVCQGVSALDYAHRHGIVHRDIKPCNLMVVDGESLKVMDFGLAKEADTHLTQTGTVIGTPHYMSPEQIQGKMLDGRSDLFSMGVVLYELVTGERPFRGEALSTIIYKILNEQPVEPRILNPSLPEALSQIIQKVLSKNPEDRYLTGGAFIHALQHYAEMGLGQTMKGKAFTPSPVQETLPPPSGPTSRTWSRRRSSSRKYLWGGLVGALAAGAAIGGMMLLRGGKTDSPVPVAAHEEKLPRPVGVETTPPGALLFLDGAPVKTVTLQPGDTSPHTVEARLGCLSAMSTVKNTPGQADLKLQLTPSGPFRFQVASDPPGAEIFVDDAATGLSTPAQLERTGCSPFRVKLVLPGREPFMVSVDPSKEAQLQASLSTEKPKGSLRLEGRSGTIRFYEGDRLLGSPGQTVVLSEGEHQVKVSDPSIRGSREMPVTIQADKTARLEAPAFATGTVFLYGAPPDGKVYVDGSYLDDLPLTGKQLLAVGPHQFRVVGPDKQEVKFSWTVREGEQAKLVHFDTRKVEDR